MVAPDEVARFLDEQSTLTLACADENGPWAADVYHVRIGGALAFYSSPKSRHAIALAADPRAAGTVHAEAEGWRDIRGVQIAGRVEPVPEPDRDRTREAYLAKFPFARPLLTGPGSLLAKVRPYRLVPEKVYWVDNETGIGKRVEVPLPELR